VFVVVAQFRIVKLVAQEARSDGEPDAYAEGLIRDIRLALSGSPSGDDANLCVK